MDFQNFLARLRQFKRLDRIVLDECHVILNKSQNFRRNLRRLGELIEQKTQILLLTATLPPRYEGSLFETLFLDQKKASIYRLPSNRSNIRYSVYYNQTYEDILTRIQSKDIQYSSDRLIVYTRTIDQAKQLAQTLDWPVYYSQSPGRERVLRKFLDPTQNFGRIVATSALGLGLDIPNIRAIIHIDRPYRLYEYSQESGRAGRDGKKSEALLLLFPSSDQSTSRSKNRDDIFEYKVIDQYTEELCRRFILSLYLDNIGKACESTDFKCDFCTPDGSGKVYYKSIY